MRTALLWTLVALSSLSSAQFVFPKPTDHDGDPAAYTEDPFVSHYRTEFFAVFKGDFARFHKAFAEIEAMVNKSPKDAQARVWYGNGQTIESGLKLLAGQKDVARELWKQSNINLNEAVRLDPKNYNIYVVRSATLIVAARRFPADWIDRSVWTRMRDDCNKFVHDMGPERLARTSTHMRGEIYGCLGLAYEHLGDKKRARLAFETVIRLDPGTDYEVQARKELAELEVKR